MNFNRKLNQAEDDLNHRLIKVEHKFANIQIVFDFLSILILRDHSKWGANKNKHGAPPHVRFCLFCIYLLIQTFALKVINDERKKLAHHEIIDCIAEQTESVITQVCKESKLWIHPNLRPPRFSFTYSFNFTYERYYLG